MVGELRQRALEAFEGKLDFVDLISRGEEGDVPVLVNTLGNSVLASGFLNELVHSAC